MATIKLITFGWLPTYNGGTFSYPVGTMRPPEMMQLVLPMTKILKVAEKIDISVQSGSKKHPGNLWGQAWHFDVLNPVHVRNIPF